MNNLYNQMSRLAVFFVVCFLLTSCYSYKVFPVEHRNFKYGGEKKTAYVVNPNLKKEYKVLQAAGIFNLTTDSLAKDAIAIRLYPIKSEIACGNPMMASIIVLGQLPVYLPDIYSYRFDEIENGQSKPKTFKLKVAERFWFWDVFAFRKHFAEKAGQTLAANYAGYATEEQLSLNP